MPEISPTALFLASVALPAGLYAVERIGAYIPMWVWYTLLTVAWLVFAYAVYLSIPGIEQFLIEKNISTAKIHYGKYALLGFWFFLSAMGIGWLTNHHKNSQIAPFVDLARSWEQLSQEIFEFIGEQRLKHDDPRPALPQMSREERVRQFEHDMQKRNLLSDVGMTKYQTLYASRVQYAAEQIIEQGLMTREEARLFAPMPNITMIDEVATDLGVQARKLADKHGFELKGTN